LYTTFFVPQELSISKVMEKITVLATELDTDN
jgi:hypothetical protein